MESFLKKKVAGVPVWVLGIGVAGLAIGYRIFRGGGGSQSATSGGYTDAAGNVYDANGNLISAAPVAPSTTPDVSLGGGSGNGGGSSFAPEGGNVVAAPPSNDATVTALTAATTSAIGALGDIGTTQAGALGGVAETLADSQASIAGTLASNAVQGATPIVRTTPLSTPTAPVGRTVVSTKKLANGATLTTYSDGRQVEKAPGKSAYVTKK